MPNTSSAADLLRRQLAATAGEKPKPIADGFAQAVGRRLESRRIAVVPGLPQEDSPGSDGLDILIELHRRNEEFQAQREAQRQAEEEQRNTPKTGAGVAAAAIAGQRSPGTPLPLNGAGVLRAALGGMGANGTINGQ